MCNFYIEYSKKLESKLKEAEEGKEKLLKEFLIFQYEDREAFDEGDKLMIETFLKENKLKKH